jgi:hypothetical protein
VQKILFLKKRTMLILLLNSKPKTIAMRKHLRFFIFFIAANIFSTIAISQNTVITGNIKNGNTGDVIPAVSVTIKGSGAGTYTDEKGNFKLISNKPVPLTLVISSIGYELQEITVSDQSSPVTVSLKPISTMVKEVFVSAKRTTSRIL